MKIISSFILAFIILFFSAGFKISTHYCGDVLVTTKLTTNVVAEGCGMEMNIESDCNSDAPLASDKNCCKDNLINLEIEDDYQPTDLDVSNLNFEFINAYVYVFFNNYFQESHNFNFREYSPPLPQQNIIVEQQTFLI